MRELIVYAAVWILKWCHVDAQITVSLKHGHRSMTILSWDFKEKPSTYTIEGGESQTLRLP